MVRLGDVCAVQNGFAFDSGNFSNRGTPVIRIRDVVRGYTDTCTTESFRPAYLVNRGDLLIGMDGEFNIAKWRSGDALLNQRVCRLFEDAQRVLKDYLFYCLPGKLKAIEAATPFATVKHLSSKTIKEIRIPLPPLPVQRAIAAALDQAAALIALRKQQIEKLDMLVQARFAELFGDPVRNEMGWEVHPLGALCLLKSGKYISAAEISAESGEGLFPCYGGNGIRGHVRMYSHSGAFNLIGRQGALCGNVRLTGGRFYATEHAVVVSPLATISPHWLYHLLGKLNLNKLSIGAAQPGLTIEKLSAVPIPLPPLPLQQRFAALASQTQAQKQSLGQAQAKLRLQYDALMQEYFGLYS